MTSDTSKGLNLRKCCRLYMCCKFKFSTKAHITPVQEPAMEQLNQATSLSSSVIGLLQTLQSEESGPDVTEMDQALPGRKPLVYSLEKTIPEPQRSSTESSVPLVLVTECSQTNLTTHDAALNENHDCRITEEHPFPLLSWKTYSHRFSQECSSPPTFTHGSSITAYSPRRSITSLGRKSSAFSTPSRQKIRYSQCRAGWRSPDRMSIASIMESGDQHNSMVLKVYSSAVPHSTEYFTFTNFSLRGFKSRMLLRNALCCKPSLPPNRDSVKKFSEMSASVKNHSEMPSRIRKSSAFKSEAPDILVQSQAVTTDDKIVENYSLSNGYSKGNDAGSFQFFEKLHQIAQDDSEPRSIREPVPEDFFTFIELIGQGNFGKVYRACFKMDGQMVAIKVLFSMNRRNAEKELQALTLNEKSPFLVANHSSFSTMSALYLVNELVTGGALSKKLGKRFTTEAAAFISAQISSALICLNENGILYRDLKPDNILFTEEGNIKLCDFGSVYFGAFGNKKVTVSTGTPRYWSPERFLQEPYGRPADWWSLGLVLFQMLSARFPFSCTRRHFDDFMETVINSTETYEDFVSEESVSACKGFLRKDPNLRLGGPWEFQCVYDHPFFKHIDWDALNLLKIPPPPLYEPDTCKETENTHQGE